MDPETLTNIQNLLNIVLGGFVVTLLTVIGLILGLWKQASMLKAEKRKVIAEADKMDIEKQLKKVELAEAFDHLATLSANKAADATTRLSIMEDNYENLLRKVNAQEEIIQEQQEKIKRQNDTIKIQDKRIAQMLEKSIKQDEEIAKLTCQVDLYQGIFSKMKEKGIVPDDIANEILGCGE